MSEEQTLMELVDSGALDQAIAMESMNLKTAKRGPLFWELIETAKRRKALISKFQGAPTGVTEIRCAGCKLALRVVCPSSQSISCYGCGTLTDLSTLKSAGTLPARESKSFLKIGMEGRLGEIQVRIIGRAVYFANIREWDSEDSVYERGTWRWAEWSLLTSGGEIWYLCVDAEGYSLSKSFTPENPMVPRAHTDRLNFNSGTSLFGMGGYRIDEWGEAKITECEGEFSWVPDKNESIRYAEYPSGGETVGVEWRSVAGSALTTEAEFYRARSLSYLQVVQTFNIKELLDAELATKSYRSERVRWATPFLIAGLLFFLLGVGADSSGRAVFAQHIDSIASLPDEGMVLGPIQLKNSGTVHRLHFLGNIPDNSDIWVGVELLDDSQDAINASDAELWHESGYDEGEYYSESSVSINKVFYLHKAGDYYLRVYGEPDPAKPIDGSLKVELLDKASAGNLYIYSSILMILVWLIVVPKFRFSPKPEL